MKPLGITPLLEVRKPSHVEDAIWEAVQSAIDNGWSPERFKNEVVSAWTEKLRDEMKHAQRILSQ